MKRWVAAAATAGMMAAVLVVLAWNPASAPGPAEGCEQCVRRVFESGSQGDVDGYLEQFTGGLRSRLDEEVRQRGRAGFARHLKETVGSLKGWVSFPAEFSASGEAQIRLERVYADYNEQQVFRLRQVGGRWKISELGASRTHVPSIRYGTPAFPEAQDKTDSQEGDARDR